MPCQGGYYFCVVLVSATGFNCVAHEVPRPLNSPHSECREKAQCWRHAGDLFESAGRLGEEGFWVFSR